jgi:hypothetical protein
MREQLLDYGQWIRQDLALIYFNVMRGSEPGIEPAISNTQSKCHIHNITVFGYLLSVEIWTEFERGL